MTVVNIFAIIFFLGVFIWATITYIYPYMKKNTSNPVLYTFLSFVALFAIIYVTRANTFLGAVLVNDIFLPMFR